MTGVSSLAILGQPHIVRLQSLVTLTPGEIDDLMTSGGQALHYPARREIVHVGAPHTGPRILIEGWAAHVRDFRDGRRQILSLVTPGEMIVTAQHLGERATSTIVALTDTLVAAAPPADDNGRGLGLAYSISAEVERLCLSRQVARIGRLDAFERLADLLIELAERLVLAGLSDSHSYTLPLTQEMIADCLGLTSVHVNRTLQQMRREGMIDDARRTVRLLDPPRLRSLLDYQPLFGKRHPADRDGSFSADAG